MLNSGNFDAMSLIIDARWKFVEEGTVLSFFFDLLRGFPQARAFNKLGRVFDYLVEQERP
jgi:hypothetical protein